LGCVDSFFNPYDPTQANSTQHIYDFILLPLLIYIGILEISFDEFANLEYILGTLNHEVQGLY
jgi:hypothetical protein